MWKILSGAALVAALVWWFSAPAPHEEAAAPRTGPAAPAAAPEPVEGAAASSRPAVVAAAPFADRAPAVDPEFLRGVVVDATGGPIGGAFVTAEPAASTFVGGGRIESSSRFATSEADGTFAVRRPSGAAAFDLRATAVGYAATVEAGVREEETPIRLTLTRGRTVRGVVRAAAGAPIPGARIAAAAAIRGVLVESATRTDGEGRYEIAGLPPATPGVFVRLSVDADGFAPQVRGMGLAPLADVEDFVMVRGAVLTGVVRAESDGRPLAGAEVVWWTMQAPLGNSTFAGRTVLRPLGSRVVARTVADADGRYRFEHVPAEAAGARFDVPFRAGAKRLGGVGAFAVGYAAGGAAVDLPLEDGATVEADVELPAAGTVVGRVVDGLGRPLAGARVYVGDLPLLFQGTRGCVPDEEGPLGGAVRTDDDGFFEHAAAAVPRAPETVARLLVNGEDHGLLPHLRVETTVIAGGRTDVGTLVLGPTSLALVRGVVVDEAGTPVAGAAVNGGTGRSASTDGEGRFEVAVYAPPPDVRVPPFPHGAKLSVYARGFVDAKAPFPEAGAEARIVLVRGAATPPPRAASAPVGTRVTVLATDAEGRTLSAAVATTFLGADPLQGPIPRVASGTEAGPGTSVVRLRAGRWRVRATAAGHLPATADFDVAEGGGEATVMVGCVAAAVLRGRVTTSSGNPLPPTRVVAEPLDAPGAERPLSCDAASNGDYRLDGLAPGRWRVRAERADGSPLGAAEEVAIPAGAGEIRRDLRTE